MTVFEDKNSSSSSNLNNGEIRWSSRAVSRGVAIGKVVCLHGLSRQFYRIDLKKDQVGDEIERFSAAVELTRRQLKKISLQNKKVTREKNSGIFETHLLILQDNSLLKEIRRKITEELVNAEWAAKIVLDGFIANYKAISDEHLRERYIDLQDISDRLLNALGGGTDKTPLLLEKDSVIVADEVKPSTLIEFRESEPIAIIAENGGWTSHTFILARELNLPSVTGTKGILRSVNTGDRVIVDGYNGEVILHPTAETLEKYRRAEANFQKVNITDEMPVEGKPRTLDGREITIRANLDLSQGYQMAKSLGAEGVGLYRSEFLFNQYKGYPTESEQIDAYRRIGRSVGDKGVRIRTFDLSIDQLNDVNFPREGNPALGLRGIRLSLTMKKEFRRQIRALLRAAADYRIDIILPMISDVSEIRRTRELIGREKAKLKKQDVPFGNPKVGVMIEVPSSVMAIDDIASKAEFMCLGTNDLVQYLLAVDRDNESVSGWFQTLHPSVIKAIEKVIAAGLKHDTPLIICGEIAGSPFYIPVLIGLGATDFSMNVNSIARVRRTLMGIAFEEALEIAEKIKVFDSARKSERLLIKCFEENWSHLLSPEILPPR